MEKWEEKSHKVPTQRWASRSLLEPIAGPFWSPLWLRKHLGHNWCLNTKKLSFKVSTRGESEHSSVFTFYILYICFNAKIRCWFCRRSPFVSLSLHIVHKTTVKREKNMQAEAVSETATFIVISKDANQRRDFTKLLICSITADSCHLFRSQESISCLQVCQRVPEWHYNLNQE